MLQLRFGYDWGDTADDVGGVSILSSFLFLFFLFDNLKARNAWYHLDCISVQEVKRRLNIKGDETHWLKRISSLRANDAGQVFSRFHVRFRSSIFDFRFSLFACFDFWFSIFDSAIFVPSFRIRFNAFYWQVETWLEGRTQIKVKSGSRVLSHEESTKKFIIKYISSPLIFYYYGIRILAFSTYWKIICLLFSCTDLSTTKIW